MPVTTIRLPEDLYEIIREKAFKEHTSINKIVVNILQKELENKNAE